MLVLIAVLPLPKTSNDTPRRGEMSFQFWTRPVQLFCRLWFGLRRTDELVVAHARVDRHPADGPPILSEDAGVHLDRVTAIGRDAQRDADGIDVAVGQDAVVGDRLHVAVVLLREPPPAFRETPTEPEGMR